MPKQLHEQMAFTVREWESMMRYLREEPVKHDESLSTIGARLADAIDLRGFTISRKMTRLILTMSDQKVGKDNPKRPFEVVHPNRT